MLSQRAGSTEAQHPYRPVKIHALLAQRCLGVSWALPEPNTPLSGGKFRDAGLFAQGNRPKPPPRPLSRWIHSLTSAQMEAPAGRSHGLRQAGGFAGSGG